MKLLRTLFLLLLALSGRAATIVGRVTGGPARENLIGAVVVVQGTSLSAPVDAAGHYEIRHVPAGRYVVGVSFVGYRQEAKSVSIRGTEEAVTLDFSLQAQAQDLGNVVVTGKLSREEDAASRRTEHTADNVLNVIAARAIERSPDINVANVLTRVSGVTVQRQAGGSGGAYAVIRGMEPRYNNTLVNGVKIASPDAQSRFIPLDIIPSDLIQRIEVHKALLPSMEGDAIGGTVNIVTKTAPDTTLLLATGSVGYGQLFLDRKWSWFDKAAIQQQSPNERAGQVVTSQPGDFSRANLHVSPKQAPANSTAGLTYGRRFLNQRLGFIAAASWQDQYFGSNGTFAEVQPQLNESRQNVTLVSAPRLTSSHQRNVGLVTHVDFVINPRNKIGWHNLLLLSDFSQARTSTDSSLVDQHTIAGTGTMHDYVRTLTQRQLVENAKLEGVHELRPNLLLDWAAVATEGRERAPDWATVNLVYLLRVDPSDPTGRRIQRTQSFLEPVDRLWRHNDNRDLSGLLNLTYQPTLFGQNLELKAGGLYRHTTRYNRQDDYTLKPALGANGAKEVFTGIETASWEVYNTQGTAARDPSNYDGTEDIAAGYGQAKLELGALQVLGGVRVESTSQHFTTLQKADILTDPGHPDNFAVTYQDVLPSLHLRYALTPSQNLRLSYFAGLTRPSLVEKNPNLNVGPNNSTVGNLNLRRATADNFDLRYELYASNEGLFTVGTFYKRIQDPIEYAYLQVTGSQLVLQPQNFGTANNYGAEVVATKYFGNIGVTGNYTYVNSSIHVSKTYNTTDAAGNTSQVTLPLDRPLQGQARNIANVSLLYRARPARFYAQLSYQFTDRTLQVVNSAGPDYYQQPQSFLALSLEKGLSRRFTAFGKFNNLLNTPATLKVGTSDLIVQRDEVRADYLLGLRYALR
ncbi:outer membrane beta-barrel protein [Hymenobacter sp. BRD128]|uniref:TonB-dependent receptor n=1 Tax=Hymenobacter sp. BRD128 TaxID=2675878 RepID=UPI00156717F4|nr:TonB-dependent receptor [Hymenobacter sp. BRD128]QKG58456.1 outer membrane beta-barrel protein [Hymenobacter sp. BRD128]